MADSRAEAPPAGAGAGADGEDDRLDAGLALAAQQGDARAFEALLGRHEARVLRLVRLLGIPLQDRDDVAQEVFVRVFRHLARFRGGGSFSGWLYRITVNAAHDHRVRHGRRRAVERVESEVGSFEEPVDPGPTPADDADRDAALRQLERALGLLSERERAVFVLCRVEEVETRDVAKILGISRITVRRHLGRARERLRRAMAEAEDPEKKTRGR